MNKRLLYIGIVILIIAIIIFSVVSYVAVPSSGSTKIILQPGMSAYYTVNLTGAKNIASTAFKSNTPVDFYYMNSSAFAYIRQYMGQNRSIFQIASNMTSNGVLEILQNATFGVFPYTSYLNSSKPTYASPILAMPLGSYYGVFKNKGSSIANITAVAILMNKNSVVASSIAMLAALILFFAAIVIIIIAFIKKPKLQPEQAKSEDELANKMYSEIESKHQK